MDLRCLLQLAAIGVWAGLCPVVWAAGHEWEFPLRDLELSGLKLERGRIALADAVRLDEATAVEAEDAASVAPAVELVGDDQASGEVALQTPEGAGNGVGEASFVLEVPVEGQYVLWLRTLWPSVGSNSFLAALDGGAPILVGNDETPALIGLWHWCAGPTWHLAAGVHNLRLVWREDGALLDRLLIAKDAGAPPNGLGPEAKRPERVPQGTLVTPDFSPPWVDHWRRIGLRGSHLQRAAVEVSADGGETWARVPGDGGLESMVPGGEGAKVRFRVTLAAEAGAGGEPILRCLDVSYVGADYAVKLENESIYLALNVSDGRLIELRRAPDGRSCLAAPAPGPPFAVRYWTPEEGRVQELPLDGCVLENCEEERRRDETSVYLDYRVPAPTGEVRVHCSATLGEGQEVVWWGTRVENATTDLHLVEIVAPIVHNACIGTDPHDDYLIWPAWCGHKISDPAAHGPLRGLYCSGSATMGWLDLYDLRRGGQGLYLASHDKTGLLTGLAVQPSAGAAAVDLLLSRFPRVLPGEEWEGEPFAIGVHDGDWHRAADWYRDWVYTWLPRASLPAWLADSDGWLGSSRPASFEQDIPARFRFAKSLGLDYTQWWGQMMVGPGEDESGCDRFYFPDPRYGTEEDLTAAVRYVRDAGGHIGFYTNGQSWNPRYPEVREEYQGKLPPDLLIPSWEDGFKENAVVGPDGGYVPQYDKPPGDTSPYEGAFYLMCPAAQGWQDYLYHYIVERYFGQYGVDAMYVDQVGAAPAQLCFSSGHGHREVGAWTRGHLANFRHLRRGARGHEPHAVLATEGFGDLYSSEVSLFLIAPASTGVWPESAPEVLRYTFPDCVFFDGFANGMQGATRSPEEVLNEVFLLGNRFDVHLSEGDLAQYFRRVLALRRETKQLLYAGRFLDDVGLSVSGEGVRAKLFRVSGPVASGWLVNCLNPQGVTDGTVRLDLELLNRGRPDDDEPGQLRGLAARFDGRLLPIEVEQSSQEVSFRVPAAPLSTVVLLERSIEAMIWATLPLVAPGSSGDIVIHYRPLGPVRGQHVIGRFKVPEGWEAPYARWDPQEVADVHLPLRAPETAEPDVYLIEITVQMANLVWPSQERLLVVEPVEATSRITGGGLRVELCSLSDRSLRGDIVLRLPEGITAELTREEFTLEPRGTAVCVLPVRFGQMDVAKKIAVDVEVGGRRIKADVTVQPTDPRPRNWYPQQYEGEVATTRDGDILGITTASVTSRGGWGYRMPLVSPGQTVRFGIECRTEEIVSDEGGAMVRVIFPRTDDLMQAAAPWVTSEPVTGTTDWQTVELEFRVPEDCAFIQVELFNWHAKGRSWWRNPRLEVGDE